MSKPILEQLYDGEIYPGEQIRPSTQRYKELSRSIEEMEDYFLKSLSKSEHDRFVELKNMYEDIQAIYSYEDFSHGYKLGVRLTCEAFVTPQQT